MTNPYAAPTSDVEQHPTQKLGEQRNASTGQRFANLLVDYVALITVNAIIGALMVLLLGMDEIGPGLDFIVGTLVMFAYYAASEATFGRSMGKLVTGTRVVDVDGGPPSFGQILKRTALRFVPFEAFSFFGPNGLHDRLSGTRVIRTR